MRAVDGTGGLAPSARRRPGAFVLAGGIVACGGGLGDAPARWSTDRATFSDRSESSEASDLSEASELHEGDGWLQGPWREGSTPIVPPGPEAGAAPGTCAPDMAFLPGPSHDGPAPRRARLEGFCLDRTEVTVGAYRACVRAGLCTEPPWQGECNARDADASQPINCVGWEQAMAHCAAEGKRLPTEHEWAWAAQGAARRPFPWGDETPGPLLVNGCGAECQPADHALHPVDDRWATTAPVGSFPAGATPEGVFDLAGNVAEWTASVWCDEDARGCDERARVVRGGHYRSHLPASLRGASRQRLPIDPGNPYVGFRCARTPLESSEE